MKKLFAVAILAAALAACGGKKTETTTVNNTTEGSGAEMGSGDMGSGDMGSGDMGTDPAMDPAAPAEGAEGGMYAAWTARLQGQSSQRVGSVPARLCFRRTSVK